jgi:hypothetical protein
LTDAAAIFGRSLPETIHTASLLKGHERTEKLRLTRDPAQISELMMIALRTIAIVIALMAPTVALAATPGDLNPAVRTACEADAQKFCSTVIGDRDSRRRRMVQHHAQLSGVCKTAVARRKAAGSAQAGGDFCENHCLRYCAMKQPVPGLYRGECHTACQQNCYRTRAEKSSASHQ